MNISDLDALRAALTALEGTGVGSCWDTTGPYSLGAAVEKYQEVPADSREDVTGWYECIYGNGGWSRYFVNLGTGEVTFSAFHSYPEKIARAEALGFRLH